MSHTSSLAHVYLVAAHNGCARQSNEINRVARRETAGHDVDNVTAMRTGRNRQLECNTSVALFRPHDERVVITVVECSHTRMQRARTRVSTQRAYSSCARPRVPMIRA